VDTKVWTGLSSEGSRSAAYGCYHVATASTILISSRSGPVPTVYTIKAIAFAAKLVLGTSLPLPGVGLLPDWRTCTCGPEEFCLFCFCFFCAAGYLFLCPAGKFLPARPLCDRHTTSHTPIPISRSPTTFYRTRSSTNCYKYSTFLSSCDLDHP